MDLDPSMIHAWAQPENKCVLTHLSARWLAYFYEYAFYLYKVIFKLGIFFSGI